MSWDADEVRLAVLRRMTPAQKLRATFRLYESARAVKAAGLRKAHPDWTEAQIQKEVRRVFLFRAD